MEKTASQATNRMFNPQPKPQRKQIIDDKTSVEESEPGLNPSLLKSISKTYFSKHINSYELHKVIESEARKEKREDSPGINWLVWNELSIRP